MPPPSTRTGTCTSDPTVGAAGRVGPNAITQLIPALKAVGSGSAAADIFAAADVTEWLAAPPTTMVVEGRVARVHQTLRARLPPRESEAALAEAGRLTADYLLANRIPRVARFVLKLLPAPVAAYQLIRAIGAHAWTFAGTGRFSADSAWPIVLRIENNPFCAGERAEAPVCGWHAAVFQRLFAVLVSRSARVTETECEARGDACCRFVVAWGTRRAERRVHARRLVDSACHKVRQRGTERPPHL